MAKGPSVIVDFTGLSLNGISLHIGVGIMGASSPSESQWVQTISKFAFESLIGINPMLSRVYRYLKNILNFDLTKFLDPIVQVSYTVDRPLHSD